MQLLDLGQIKIKLRTLAMVVERCQITKVFHLVKEGGSSQDRSKIGPSWESKGQCWVWLGLASGGCQQAEVVVWGVVGAGLRPTNVFHLVKGGTGGLSTTARPWGRVLMARLPLFVHLLGARKWTDFELYQFLLRALAQHERTLRILSIFCKYLNQ